MGDYDVRMQFEVAAEPRMAAARLKGTDAIASWWSDRVDGEASATGDRFSVSFPDAPAPFELEVTKTGDASVEWYVAAEPEWWADTTVRVEVGENPMGEGSLLMFTHGGFDPSSPVIPIVTPVWAQVIERLKAVVESGVDDPFFVNAS